MDVEAQLTELNAAIADLVESASTEKVAQTLGEILAVLKERKGVTVNVSPTPINNVVNVPAVERCDYRFDFTYNNDGRITGAKATRLAPKVG